MNQQSAQGVLAALRRARTITHAAPNSRPLTISDFEQLVDAVTALTEIVARLEAQQGAMPPVAEQRQAAEELRSFDPHRGTDAPTPPA
jgi:hypothetical protein